MKRPKSDIPPNAVEEFVSPYKQEGALLHFRTMNCVLNGEVVGNRQYSESGSLMSETPMRNGKKHGREYTWWEDGSLLLVEPYFEGKIHGVARQYGPHGKVIGTYKFVHGTGFDIWRGLAEDGSVYISEVHSMQAGRLHGYEWWLGPKDPFLWHERHWHEGLQHGVERVWNDRGRLRRGYPKYWIRGEAVTRRQYLRAAQKERTLPAFRGEDNSPHRTFPPEIQRLVASQ